MNATEANRVIARFASRHHALVRTDLVEDLGVSREQLRRRAHQGMLTQIDDTIYCISGAPETWRQDVLSACWMHGPGAHVSHRSATWLWGLDGIEHAPLEVLVPRWSRRQKRTSVVVHESKTFGPTDQTVIDGIPCTSIVRTILDLPAVVPAYRADQLFEDALRKRLCTIDQIANRFVQIARRGRPGTSVARELIEKRTGDYIPTMSEFERRVSDLLVAAGLPRPQRQIAVAIRDTTVHIDLGWTEVLIGIECDGLIAHGDNTTLPWDDDRQNELQLRGWFILRITWTMLVDHPTLIVAQLREAIRLRRLAVPA